MNLRISLAAFMLLGLGACASSPPVRYYTLVPPVAASAPGTARSIDGVVDLSPVQVPAQADYPQLVVRQGPERVALMEGQQWIAPLADEVRSALVARLSSTLPPKLFGERPRLDVEILRFESALGQYALLEAQWQLKRGKGDPLSCFTRSVQKVGPGFDALVAGHQRAVDRLADDIAAGIAGLASPNPACPAA